MMESKEPALLDLANERLATAIEALLTRYRALAEENQLLHEQMRQLRAERAMSKERTEQARHHVESMITRLRAMEYPE